MTAQTKRGTIVEMLNVSTEIRGGRGYLLSTYARRASKAIGREVSKSEVKSTLRRMARTGRVTHFLSGEHCFGWEN